MAAAPARTGASNTNPQRINPQQSSIEPRDEEKKTQNFPADEHSAKSLFALDLSTSLPKLLPISLCLSLSTAFVRRRERKGRKRRESQQP